MQLGIGSYTYVWWAGVPGYPPPPEILTPRTLLDVAHSLGVRVVQIADNMPLDALSAAELKDIACYAQSLGITIEAGTRGVLPHDLRRWLGICEIVGARLLRTLVDGPDHQPQTAEAASMVREVARDFESAGVMLAIENHDRFKANDLREIVERAESVAVGVCLDTANSLACGEATEQVISRVGDFVVNLHVKDFTVRRLPHNKGFIVEGAPAGQGLLDIPGLLKYLQRLGRDVNVILEQWPPPEESIAATVDKERRWADQGIRYLRPLIA